MSIIGRENLIVHIVDRFDCFKTEIWIFENQGSKMFNINYQEDGKLIKHPLKDEISLPYEHGPFLSLPKPFADMLFNKIQEQQSNKGIKPKDQTLIEGKLQATESHLQDMRKMAEKLIDFVTSKT
jgi:CobQ-like glutamine amidotransferase family enzyme